MNAPSPEDRARQRLHALLVFLAGTLVFVTALGNGFIGIDDDRVLVEQPFLRALTPANLWRCLSPWPAREEYLPLRDLTYMLQFALTGDRPWGFVAGNLLLHGAASVAVLGLFRRLLAWPGALSPAVLPRAREAIALTAALIFALHPIHAESVVWVSGRKDPLSTLLVVLALCQYLDGLRASDGARRRGRFGLAWLLFVLALGAKASAVCVPLLIGAAEVLLAPRGRPWAARAVTVAAFAAPAALFVRFYTGLLAQFGAASAEFVVKRHPEPAWKAILFTDASVVRQYLRRLVLPTDPQLFAEQPWRLRLDLDVVSGLLVVGLAAAGAVWLCRRRPPLGFAAAWFFLALAPYLNLVPHGIVYAERYVYVPSAGFALLAAVAAWGAAGALPRPACRRRRLALLVAPYLALCAVNSLRLAPALRDDATLWAHVVERQPQNVIALTSLAGAAREQGDLERARALLDRALALAPDRALVHYQLGVLATARGDHDAAFRHYHEASRRQPDAFDALSEAASALARAGRTDEAVALYEALLRRWPRLGARAAFEVAVALHQAGREEAARAAFHRYLARYGQDPREAPFAAAARRALRGESLEVEPPP